MSSMHGHCRGQLYVCGHAQNNLKLGYCQYLSTKMGYCFDFLQASILAVHNSVTNHIILDDRFSVSNSVMVI